MLEAANAFLITDAGHPDNPMIDASPAFTVLTGYPREAVLGRNCRFLQGPETDPAAINALRQSIATEQPQPVTLLNYCLLERSHRIPAARCGRASPLEQLLYAARTIEVEPTLLGLSPHLMAIARRP